MSPVIVHEAIAAAVAAEAGDGPIYQLIGDGNLMICGALARRGATLRAVRHEGAAVAAADGYHRATGRVGVASITHGPGLTHAATSLAAAARARSAIVTVTGELAIGALNRLQEIDQRTIAEACGAKFVAIESPARLGERIAEAFASSRAQRRPIVLAAALDVQAQTVDDGWTYEPSPPPTPAVTPSAAQVARIVDRLTGARTPVIVAGLGAKRAGAGPALASAAARAGALVGSTLHARNLFADDPFDLGVVGSYATSAAETLLGEADFVLGVGAEFGFYTTEGGKLFARADIIRIDDAGRSAAPSDPTGLIVEADAGAAAAAIAAELARRGGDRVGARTQTARDLLARRGAPFEIAGDGIDPRRLAQAVGRALPPHAVVTCGVGHFSAFPAMHMALPADADIYFSLQFAAVGQTLPLALGVAEGHRGRPHLVIEGDGSLMMNMQEIETAARLGLDMTVLVWNDGGLGAEFHKLASVGHDVALAKWPSPDFASLARSLGGDGVVARDLADAEEALRRGFAAGGLFIIDARVSPTVVSNYTARRFDSRLPNIVGRPG